MPVGFDVGEGGEDEDVVFQGLEAGDDGPGDIVEGRAAEVGDGVPREAAEGRALQVSLCVAARGLEEQNGDAVSR